MNFFNNFKFPWSNMHGLNLDWVINIIKELETQFNALIDLVNTLIARVDKKGTVVNVAEVEPNADGVLDDWETLQTFFNDNAGKIIEFNKGDNYYISQKLIIPENTIIRGNGGIVSNVYTNITLFELNSGVEIYDVEFIGGSTAVVDIDGRAISIVGTVGAYKDKIIISGCNIHDVSFYGIYGEFASNIDIKNCKFTNIAYAGILFLSGKNILVDNATIKNVSPGSAGNAYGVSFSRDSISNDLGLFPRSKDCIVRNCYIDGIPIWDGIDTHGGENILVEGNTIKNCNVGISFVGNTDYATINSKIINNVVYGLTTGSGIRSVGKFGALGAPTAYAENNIINGNTIYEGGQEGNSNNGAIYLESNKNLSVVGNALNESYVNGICAYSDNKGCAISGNTIRDTQSSGVVANGMVIRSQYNELMIGNNNFMRDDIALNVSVMLFGINMTAPTNNDITVGVNRTTADINNNGMRGQEVSFGEKGNDVDDYVGINTPEGVITANVGSTFIATNGGAGTTLFVKESGVGNTGWVGK